MNRILRGGTKFFLVPLAAASLTACSDSGPSGPGGPLPDGGARISGQLTATPSVAAAEAIARGLSLAQGDDFVGDVALADVTVQIVDGDGNVVSTTATNDSGEFSAEVEAGLYTVNVLVGDQSVLSFTLDVPEGGTLFAEGKVDILPNGKLKLDVQIFRDNDGDGEPDDSFRIRIMGRVEGDLSSGDVDVVANQDDIQDMVTICHIPPGNPNAAHTIVIGAPALQAHLGHGDFEGECDGDEGASDNDLDDDGVEDDAGQAKILVCHVPPGDPENPVTIEIAEPALASHLAHGDTEGACPGDSGPTGDDEENQGDDG